MILSRSRHFLFIKTVKTAGTSIEVALARHCDDRDVVTPIDPRDLLVAAPQHRARNAEGFFNHMPLHEILRTAPEARGWYRFTAERNPWDKVVSKYHFEREAAGELSFGDWFEHAWTNGTLPINWPLYALDGRPGVDFVIRYENLRDDFERVCREVGLPPEPLPFVKAEYRADKSEYRSYFDARRRDAVARAFHREIDWFGYSF